MFTNTLETGNIIALAFLIYANTVMLEAVIRAHRLPAYMNPPVLNTGYASFIFLLSIPTGIWPAVYVGIHDGLLAGFLAWILFMITGHILGFLIRVKTLVGFHFHPATALMFTGYFLTIKPFFT
ncbi:hypothetical protein [Thiomicrospira sp. ALE5]|uniref:hypothetical protein n=1 Tax=Thiomicrospira sp. ALE5 TaxID=748650 RepID=UPI000B83559F|nr:hypothetical protein [Thiomicrospira sp. ALE5]